MAPFMPGVDEFAKATVVTQTESHPVALLNRPRMKRQFQTLAAAEIYRAGERALDDWSKHAPW
eukprot:4854473-Lingulodinium_polyedra.AAC.1